MSQNQVLFVPLILSVRQSRRNRNPSGAPIPTNYNPISSRIRWSIRPTLSTGYRTPSLIDWITTGTNLPETYFHKRVNRPVKIRNRAVQLNGVERPIVQLWL